MPTMRSADFAGPGIMLISALIFGWFGFGFDLGLPFGVNWSTPGVDGNPVLFRLLIGWTLKISGIVFVISAIVTLAMPVLGNAVFSFVGLIGARLFVVAAVMDLRDQQHAFMPYGPFVLLIFAAWNGYGSWQGVRGVVSAMRAEGDAARAQQTM